MFALATLVLIVSGKIEVSSLLRGLSNPSIISIFLLIILTSAINDHFNLSRVFDRIFEGAKGTKGFVSRLSFSVATLSSVMNNTPIVAFMIPYVYQWGRKHGVSPAKLLIPLSYATILGGMITVIGTSTNLILFGFIEAENAVKPGFLDFLIPGVMVTIVGTVYIVLFHDKLLPDNKDLLEDVTENMKEYLVETRVVPDSDIIGKTVQAAGLRNLDGIYLVEIFRDNHSISPVSSEDEIQDGDRLFFAGEAEKVLQLVKHNKALQLSASTMQNTHALDLIEIVIPANSHLIGKTLKEVLFRDKYDAAAIAIHRNGEKLRGKLGEIVLDKGDILLVSAGSKFRTKVNQSKDVYMVSSISANPELPSKRKWAFVLGLGVVFTLMFAGFVNLITGLILILGLAVVVGITNYEHIKKNVSIDLLVILCCAIAISDALIASGGAELVGKSIIPLVKIMGSVGLIVFIYLMTVILTQFITNAAAIAIVFPVGYALSLQSDANPVAIFIAMAFGASCSFISPVGYQTNLMVYGPGGYKFSHFLRFGLPLTLIYSAIVLSWIIFRY